MSLLISSSGRCLNKGFASEAAKLWLAGCEPPAMPLPPQAERYFKLQNTLPSVGYWFGAERPSPSDPFELNDGGALPQVRGAGRCPCAGHARVA